MQQLKRLVQSEPRGTHLRLVFFSFAVRASHRVCTTTAATGARWTCSCGFNNYAFHRQCFCCHTPRSDLPTVPKASPMTLLDDLNAAEGESNGLFSGAAAHTPVVPAEGVWMCAACNTFNNPSRGTCVHCGETRPGQRQSGQMRRPTPSLPSNEPSLVSSLHATAPQPFMRGDWYCSCGEHNFARNNCCRKCHTPVPIEKTVMRRGGSKGDWVCPECGMYNFARRTKCMRCHHLSPSKEGNTDGITEVSAASSLGWVCQACHSMNPSDAGTTCVICGTAK